ncbi:hypothetical protein, partial [Motilimonas sp. E26]|uniref:hypothetical protein n=1 Tax=Motilimonas sp. E26 TaxID=2865674 RepID=UPI001E5375A0
MEPIKQAIFLKKEKFYSLNAALSGQKLWVIMCSVAKRNPLFLFHLNALLNEAAARQSVADISYSSYPLILM